MPPSRHALDGSHPQLTDSSVDRSGPRSHHTSSSSEASLVSAMQQSLRVTPLHGEVARRTEAEYRSGLHPPTSSPPSQREEQPPLKLGDEGTIVRPQLHHSYILGPPIRHVDGQGALSR